MIKNQKVVDVQQDFHPTRCFDQILQLPVIMGQKQVAQNWSNASTDADAIFLHIQVLILFYDGRAEVQRN